MALKADPLQVADAAIIEETEHQRAGLGRGAGWGPGSLLLAGLLLVVSHFGEMEHFLDLADGARALVCAPGTWPLALQIS
jgi:hypothetical protein